MNKGQPRERQNMVFKDRWSLFGGYFVLFYQERVIEVWSLFAGWSLFGGGLLYKFDCTVTYRIDEVYFRSYSFSDECGGHIQLTASSLYTITSPGYPNFYERGLKCFWLIQVGQKIDMKIISHS